MSAKESSGVPAGTSEAKESGRRAILCAFMSTYSHSERAWSSSPPEASAAWKQRVAMRRPFMPLGHVRMATVSPQGT